MLVAGATDGHAEQQQQQQAEEVSSMHLAVAPLHRFVCFLCCNLYRSACHQAQVSVPVVSSSADQQGDMMAHTCAGNVTADVPRLQDLANFTMGTTAGADA